MVLSSRQREKLNVFLIKMKLLTALIFAGTMTLSASTYSQRTKIDLRLQNSSVMEILNSIEQISEFIFIYNANVVNMDVKKNISVDGERIEKVLDILFEDSGISYRIDDRQIFLYKPEDVKKQEMENKKLQLNPPSEQPQKKVLKGKVVDEKKMPIPGVTVLITGKTIGTITNSEGEFLLQVPPDSKTLSFSFVGFETQEIPIGDTGEFNIVLKEVSVGVEEVVIIGYGEQKKASVVGSISTASGTDLKRMNVSEVSNSLTGAIPGLITIQQTSIPGGGELNTLMTGSSGSVDQQTKIYIRGQSTWSGGEPLILVDGIERRMEELDPNDINSISVLKDASATSVFGVRGGNGVILITTRRGLTGKPKLTFDAQHTTSVVSKIPSPVNSYDANTFKNYAILQELSISPESWGLYVPQEILNYYRTQQYPEYFPDVNWKEEMMKDASTSYKFNTNVSGGTRFVNYFGSIGYLHEGGLMEGKDLGQGYKSNFNYNRFNFRSNLDFKFTPSTQISLNFSGNYASTTNPGFNDNPIRRMRGIYGMPPDIFPVRYADGTYAYYTGLAYENPFVVNNLTGIDRVTQTQIFTDISLEQKLDIITKGLSVKATASYDNVLTEDGRAVSGATIVYKYIDPEIIYAKPEDQSSFIYWTIPSNTNGYDYVASPVQYYPSAYNTGRPLSRSLFYQFSLNYQHDFDKHAVSALALMNRRESAAGSSFLSKREDWVGRITYNYDSRYFTEVNAGYNGSEKFDRKYRFGLFPSIAGGWMVSNESFFKAAFPWWNVLKIRYSHGKVGSDDGIARWLYQGSWKTSSKQWMLGQPITSTGYKTAFEGAVPNPDIHWETAIKRDIGVESEFFKNSLKLTFDYFWDDRKDMFIAAAERTTPVIIGAPLPAANLGKTKTRGYEFDLEYQKYFKSGIGLNARFSFGYAKDKIIYRDDPELMPDYQKQAGYPIGQTRSILDYGVIQNWDQLYNSTLYASNATSLPGDMRIIDFNADGIIDVKDSAPYGYPSRPQYNYSYNLSLSYKGLSLNALLYGVFNVTVNQNYFYVFPENTSTVYQQHLDDCFVPEMGNILNASYYAPRLLSENRGSATYGLIDGSYLRLKNVEIAYKFPDKITGKLGVSNLRIYVTGYNLWTWTKDEWFEDRESPGSASGGVVNSYPMTKRFTAGISFGF